MSAVATVAFGLGGMSYHSSCFHVANMFPRRRGFVSAMFVGFFTLSGIVFLAMRTLYIAFGGTNHAFHKLLVGYLGMVIANRLATFLIPGS
ncbi:hypothetical protein CYMTET_31298 [Cymbomonas tetramitiformis]|uniref:Uncharacterized protein n=1 Tax=Cymbomonas tetramitiformis TaxID=36881 RepID=A0AAE0FH29_9CHLO|nr:hypothetical protein CYMTET_31298 [Cymbomonas tetramitiformis]